MARLFWLAGILGVSSVLMGSSDAYPAHPLAVGSYAARQKHDAGDLLQRQAEAVEREADSLRHNQTEKDLNRAIASFQKSAKLFRAARLNSRAADATLQVGDIYFTLSKYEKALSSYREAQRLNSKSQELACLVLSHAARIYATRGQKSQADVYSKQALGQCNSLRDPKFQAEGLQARGEALWNSNDAPESAKFFSQAQELFGKANDTRSQAHALLMLAYAHFWDQRLESLQFAGKALQLSSTDRDLHGIAEARSVLGLFAAATDEFETAKCNYKSSLPMFQRVGDRDNEAITLNLIGLANWETGNVEASLENYTRAKAVFDRVHDQLGAVESITGLGKNLGAMRQYQQLLRLYREKLNIARQTGSSVQEASALADMAGVNESEHHYTEAKKLYEQSLDIYRSTKNDNGIGSILVHLAMFHERQSEHSQALELLESARAVKANAGRVEDVAKIYYEIANIDRRLHRLQDALTAIEKTIKIIEPQRLKIADFDSRATYFSSVHKYYALYIQILMSLGRQSPNGSFAESGFEASEKSKVRTLLDLLNASKEDSPCDELLQRQLATGGSTETQVAEGKDELPASAVLSLKQIQAELGSDDTLLEYLLGDEKSYLWIVDAKHISAHELLPADKIEKLVRRFHDTLTAREPLPGESLQENKERVRKADLEYPKVARQLLHTLLTPVDLTRVKRLLIVPDGFLQAVPFSALQISGAVTKSTPLIRDHEVVVLPSASVLGTLRTARNRAAPTRTAVIVADPVVDGSDPRLLRTSYSGRKKSQQQSAARKMRTRNVGALQNVTRLEGSGDEARLIRQILGDSDAVVQAGFDANRDSILQGALAPYRIIHFATHGFVDPRHPDKSGLILSLRNERGQRQNGHLSLGDISKLQLSADLVVLSACDSALGKELESEGTIGLPRAFLFAGSRSVLASLWKVDDDAAVAFMKSFYEGIKKGEIPSAALRGAQLEMSQGKRWSQPFYWAAFVLQGDYK
ncbi:MAG TPA: CHAT domain-containing protein [Candidatus Angelobacter sp.]|jgi:CHAT domain-containing protein|nr:CHAT domain-containing protein [Candidatus Angelobacter sp.]